MHPTSKTTNVKRTDSKGKEPVEDSPRKVITPTSQNRSRVRDTTSFFEGLSSSSKENPILNRKVAAGNSTNAKSTNIPINHSVKKNEIFLDATTLGVNQTRIIYPADSNKISSDVNGVATHATRANWMNINARLTNNDPSLVSLKMGFLLTDRQLDELKSTIERANTILSFISWDSKQSYCNRCQQIEMRLISNVKNFKYHPTDFVHILLSKHAYRDCKKGNSVQLEPVHNPHLRDWKVNQVYDDSKKSGYFGVIYENEKTRNLVLAVRGTKSEALDVLKKLFTSNNSVKTDIEEILGGQIVVGQQAQNYEATKYAIKRAAEKNYRLSFTGYSLGAWLAELSVFYCRAYFNKYNVEIKAVTFDSPGTKPMMERLQSNIVSRDTQVKLKELPIFTYLAKPNPVNCCNEHVGTVKCVEVEMLQTDRFDAKAPKLIKKTIGSEVHGLLAIEGHGLSKILETFDRESGQPKQYEKMADWPRMEYCGTKTFAKNGTSLMNIVIKEASGLAGFQSDIVPKVIGKVADWLIGDSTLMTIIGLLKSIVTAEINQEQYWAYFKHEGKGSHFKHEFALCAQAHYREDENKGSYMMNKKGKVDEYLLKLHKYKFSLNKDTSLLDCLLLDLSSRYTIELHNGCDRLTVVPGDDVESVKEEAKRLMEVIDKSLFNPMLRKTVFADEGPAMPRSTKNENDAVSSSSGEPEIVIPASPIPKNEINKSNRPEKTNNADQNTELIVYKINDPTELTKLQTLISKGSDRDFLATIKELNFDLFKIEGATFQNLLDTILKNEKLMPNFERLFIGQIKDWVTIKFPNLTNLKNLIIKTIGSNVELILNCVQLESFAIKLNDGAELNFCGNQFTNLNALCIKNIQNSMINSPKGLKKLKSLTIGNISANKIVTLHDTDNLENLILTYVSDFKRLQFGNTRNKLCAENTYASIQTLVIERVLPDEPSTVGKKVFYRMGATKFQKKPDFSFLKQLPNLVSFSMKHIADDTILELPNFNNPKLRELQISNINKNVDIKSSKLLDNVVKLSIDKISDKTTFQVPKFKNLKEFDIKCIGEAAKLKIPHTLKGVKFTVQREKDSDSKLSFSSKLEKDTKAQMKAIWNKPINNENPQASKPAGRLKSGEA